MSTSQPNAPPGTSNCRHLVGFTRREALQVGYSGLLGVSLTSALSAHAAQSVPGTSRKPKSVILVFLTGGASQLDTFDMKPDAPAEIRGGFQPIATSVPGLTVCEHLPRLAARANKYALVRSLAHREYNHLVATHHVLTGHPQPGAFFDKPPSRDDWPAYASGLSYLRPRQDGIPSGMALPTLGTFLPGQHAGFLGARHDPWQVTRDPKNAELKMDAIRLDPRIDVQRLDDRRTLLTQIDRQRGDLAIAAEGHRLTDKQDQAFSILTSGKVAQAFETDREPAAVRDRYGRHVFGNSLLLARRLVQAGVPMIQVNLGTGLLWDTHADHFAKLKDKLLPPMDQGMSALFDDLAATGILDDTFVLMFGEFGRTPKITTGKDIGRDHWAGCFTGLFAGAGVRGGQVIGQSDKIGAFPTTTPFSPDDIGATVYHVLGVDPASEVRDRLGRPVQLNRGHVMQCLFDAKS